MRISETAPSAHYTSSIAFYDQLSEMIKANPTQWAVVLLSEICGKTVPAKQARVHGEMKARDLSVVTCTTPTEIYMQQKQRTEEEVIEDLLGPCPLRPRRRGAPRLRDLTSAEVRELLAELGDGDKIAWFILRGRSYSRRTAETTIPTRFVAPPGRLSSAMSYGRRLPSQGDS